LFADSDSLNILCQMLALSLPIWLLKSSAKTWSFKMIVSMEHPQVDGRAEYANKVILCMKKKLDEQKDGGQKNYTGYYGHHTVHHSFIGEAPYKLLYGANAMI
jgi:hypothetical protein